MVASEVMRTGLSRTRLVMAIGAVHVHAIFPDRR